MKHNGLKLYHIEYRVQKRKIGNGEYFHDTGYAHRIAGNHREAIKDFNRYNMPQLRKRFDESDFEVELIWVSSARKVDFVQGHRIRIE